MAMTDEVHGGIERSAKVILDEDVCGQSSRCPVDEHDGDPIGPCGQRAPVV